MNQLILNGVRLPEASGDKFSLLGGGPDPPGDYGDWPSGAGGAGACLTDLESQLYI